MDNKTINISIPDRLLRAIDKQAEFELRNRSELIREAMRQYLLKKADSSELSFSKTENERMRSILEFENYSQQSLLLLSCVYRPQPIDIEDLFGGSQSEIVNLIEKPPAFRRMGWDLQTLDRVKVIAGEYAQVTNGPAKILRVYRGGQIVFTVDEEVLGWVVNDSNEEDQYSFNALAMVELVTNFVRFVGEIVNHHTTKPTHAVYKVQIQNPEHKLLNIKNKRKKSFTESSEPISLRTVGREIITKVSNGEYDYESISYKVLSEIFYFFGLPKDRFPYVNRDKEIVDIDAFGK